MGQVTRSRRCATRALCGPRFPSTGPQTIFNAFPSFRTTREMKPKHRITRPVRVRPTAATA
jgi:hypothetical protein